MVGPRRGAAGAELARLAAAAGGVLLPGHGSVHACAGHGGPVLAGFIREMGALPAPSPCVLGWVSFFVVPLGVSSRFGWRKAAQGLAEAFQH